MRININYLQLLTGLEEPVLTSKTPIPYIPHNWLTQLWDYLIDIQAKIYIEGLVRVQGLRQNDESLMKAFINKGIPMSELVILNNWRLYFKVTFLFEVCVAEGDRINPFFLKYPTGDHNNGAESRWIWPEQSMPGYKSFTLWRRHLKMTFCVNGNRIKALGNWNMQRVLATQQRVVCYHHSTQSVYIYAQDNVYRKYDAVQTRPNTAVLDNETPFSIEHHLPFDSSLADGYIGPSKSYFHFFKHDSSLYVTRNKADNSAWSQTMTRNLSVHNEEIWNKLLFSKESNVHIISDGGLYDYRGTFGVVISDGSNVLVDNM
jgi:hypothetical protein